MTRRVDVHRFDAGDDATRHAPCVFCSHLFFVAQDVAIEGRIPSVSPIGMQSARVDQVSTSSRLCACCVVLAATFYGCSAEVSEPDKGDPEVFTDYGTESPSVDVSDSEHDSIEEHLTGHGGPYPIVLAHGFLGWDKFAGLDFEPYFYGVKDALAADGELEVFTPAQDPFNSSTVRGEQLLEHIEEILAETGATKVNIIGHSQGGLDARVVASLRPDLVASVTTIASPNHGTGLADIILRVVPNAHVQGLLDSLVGLFGHVLWSEAGRGSSPFDAFRQMSTTGISDFNAMYPDVTGIPYYSIAGRTDWARNGPDCRPDLVVPFIEAYKNQLDPVDPLIAIGDVLLDGGFNRYPTDGLVRVREARWGTFLGCVPADHLDQIGQILGDKPGLFNKWDHRAFFVSLVHFLRAQGL